MFRSNRCVSAPQYFPIWTIANRSEINRCIVINWYAVEAVLSRRHHHLHCCENSSSLVMDLRKHHDYMCSNSHEVTIGDELVDGDRCYGIIFSSLFSKFQTENLSNYARTLDQHFDPELGFADIHIREANSFMPFHGEAEYQSNCL